MADTPGSTRPKCGSSKVVPIVFVARVPGLRLARNAVRERIRPN
jgi:hypothetical protein